jgi:pimeloyl-ACP methyl ester carboxylesterase
MAIQRSPRSGRAIASAAHTLFRELVAGARAVASPLHAVQEPELIRVSCSAAGTEIEPAGPRVVLVHGYASKPRAWTAIVARLSRAGFTNVWCLSYGCAGQTVPRLAGSLVEQLGDLGRAPTHLIGHSLGGLLIRYALEHHELNARSVALIATPNTGTRIARLGLGGLVAHMRPESSSIRELANRPPRPRAPWTVYYSRSDLIVRPHSAVVHGGAPLVTNVHIHGHGHLSILRSAVLANDLVYRLSRMDQRVVPARGRTAPCSPLNPALPGPTNDHLQRRSTPRAWRPIAHVVSSRTTSSVR